LRGCSAAETGPVSFIILKAANNICVVSRGGRSVATGGGEPQTVQEGAERSERRGPREAGVPSPDARPSKRSAQL